jgi:hypothetical protein
MKLWIRSKDRFALVKVNDIKLLGYTIYVNGFEFGSYTPQERALGIIDEIQTIIKQNDFTHRVYEMPEK